jgi:hypothetical protein
MTGGIMLIRVVGAVALTLSVSSGARAGNHHGIVQRVSCSVVRYYVAKYSASAAEMWARSHGATEAQIEAARRCLNDGPAQTTEATRWSE